MDYYEAWFDIADSRKDLQFSESVAGYMECLERDGLIEGYRLARRKLGFGPAGLGEFHLTIEVTDLAQLERAFQRAATRDGEVEKLHARVYSAIRDVKFALYRDFPDPVRSRSATARKAE